MQTHHSSKKLGDYVVFGGTQKLSTIILFNRKGCGGGINMRELKFIKDKHTYVNRVNNILKFL